VKILLQRIFILVILCGQTSVVVLAADKPWVLLEGDKAAVLIHQCSRESPVAIQSVWTPSMSVLETMESRLPAISKLESKICCGLGARVADVAVFHRQYAGLVIEGRKLIYINAFARTASINDWRQQPVMNCGGGQAYWGVLYDPASEVFFDLAFNGDE
jgi:hypothetical protein